MSIDFKGSWLLRGSGESDDGARPWHNEITTNRAVWGALVHCTVLLILTVTLPVLSDVLECENPGAAGGALVAAGTLLTPLSVGVTRVGYSRLRRERWRSQRRLAGE
jgi:Ca2+-transporting ATPase